MSKKILVFDTETNGLNPYTNDIVQLSWEVYDETGKSLKFADEYVQKAVLSPYNIEHLGITQDMIDERGMDKGELLSQFFIDVAEVDVLVAHNIKFDTDFLIASNIKMQSLLQSKTNICTMNTTAQFVGIERFFGYKHPKLQELYFKLFKQNFEGAHNAINDVRATAKCFFELLKLGFYEI
jgi:DNA polymerase III alpha subunit (gram-positive type)